MEKFNLKWNDCASNVHKLFQNLRTEEDFFDVTLLQDDFRQVTAHKVCCPQAVNTLRRFS